MRPTSNPPTASDATGSVSQWRVAGTAFDAFQTVLLKAEATSAANALFGLLRAEKTGKFANSHWLVLKTVAAGGGYKTKRWLWWLTTKVLYSGFLQISDKHSLPENA